MDCRDFKIQYLEQAESGAETALPHEMLLHHEGCAACQAFCQDVKAQYAALQEEKNTSSNPFLAQKIIYKMKEKKNALDVAIPAFRRLALYPAVICLGLFTGFAINYLLPADAEQTDDLTSEVTVQVTADDNGGENDVLSLNE